MEFNSSYDQTNSMGYQPPSPISNDGWGYHQEISNSGHSNSWSYASEPQDEKENHMGYFSPPQNNASHDSNGGWEGNSSAPYDIHPEISSLDHTSTESPFQNSPPTQTSMNHSWFSEFESRFNRMAEEYQQSRRELEILSQETDKQLEDTDKRLELLSKENEDQLMDVKDKVEEQDKEATASSELSMKNEVVEPETALEMTREHEDSQLSQTSPMIELLKQMLGVKEEVEEQESEEVIPNSSEAEKYIKEEFIEPQIQKALDECKTPIITQQPRLGFKEVKATNKSTNPVPNPVSKINQAICKRKLAEEKPRQGTVAETSPSLKSFLLTNWKKRKKVKNR
ncbi:hypothetical protein AHAS_Ahas11G0199100 [Arachis hypogaea]